MAKTKPQLERELLAHRIWRMERERKLIENSGVAKGEFIYVGAVTEEPVAQLIEEMDIWSRNHPGKDITLTINSQGGVVIDGFALYDFLGDLKRRGHRITTKGLGLQASMGGVLLQAGDERVMSKHSWMLVHEVQGILEGSFTNSEMKNISDFNTRLQEQCLDILSERSNWKRPSLKKKWKEDLWLDANDALAAGFIDRIEQ